MGPCGVMGFCSGSSVVVYSTCQVFSPMAETWVLIFRLTDAEVRFALNAPLTAFPTP